MVLYGPEKKKIIMTLKQKRHSVAVSFKGLPAIISVNEQKEGIRLIYATLPAVVLK